jgi:hypothetical protein
MSNPWIQVSIPALRALNRIPVPTISQQPSALGQSIPCLPHCSVYYTFCYESAPWNCFFIYCSLVDFLPSLPQVYPLLATPYAIEALLCSSRGPASSLLFDPILSCILPPPFTGYELSHSSHSCLENLLLNLFQRLRADLRQVSGIFPELLQDLTILQPQKR